MLSLILLHSAFGLDAPLLHFADRLRAAGYDVTTPDFYDGAVALGGIDDAIALRDRIGIPVILERAQRVLDAAPPESVAVGLSMGAALAHHATVAGAPMRALVLMDNLSPFDDTIPVPASVHVCRNDSFLLPDLAKVNAICERSDHVELFVYDSDRHMAALPESSGYDPVIAALVWERMLAFLESMKSAL